MYCYMQMLRKLLKEYGIKDEKYRREEFPEGVILVLRALGMDNIAEKVKKNPDLIYPVSKKIVEDFFTMKSDIRVTPLLVKTLL